MYCGKTNIPLGVKVLIIANYEGNIFEPFVGLEGVSTHPFKKGCCDKDWIGVFLKETQYGRKFNFHVDEIHIV